MYSVIPRTTPKVFCNVLYLIDGVMPHTFTKGAIIR